MTDPSGKPRYITLVSKDGFEFQVLRSAAMQSTMINKMLSSGMKEENENRCEFGDISGVVLEKVCEYFYYKQKHIKSKDVPDMDIPPELCLELLVAADFLGC